MSTPKPNRTCRFQETKTCVHKLDLDTYLRNTGFLRTFTVPVEGGCSIGHPSKWSLCFVTCGSQLATNKKASQKPCDDMDFIGIFLDSVQQPLSDNSNSFLSEIYDHQECEFIVRCSVKALDGIEDSGKSVSREIESFPISSFEKGCWCWKKVPSIPYKQFFDQNSNSNDSDDSKQLELLITFSLVAQSKYTLEKVPSSCVELMVQKQMTEREIGQNLFNFINCGSCKPDVTVESAFGRVYHVHQRVLAGRSPVFHAMFGTSMIEKTTGHVKLEDISSEALELLLRHIYTGQAEKDWLECPKIATEMVYSAEKYWLTSLTAFCDKNLIQAANRKNCLRLLELASLHDLNYACDQLTKFVHNKMEVSGPVNHNNISDTHPENPDDQDPSKSIRPDKPNPQEEDNDDDKPQLGFSITVVQAK